MTRAFLREIFDAKLTVTILQVARTRGISLSAFSSVHVQESR